MHMQPAFNNVSNLRMQGRIPAAISALKYCGFWTTFRTVLGEEEGTGVNEVAKSQNESYLQLFHVSLQKLKTVKKKLLANHRNSDLKFFLSSFIFS